MDKLKELLLRFITFALDGFDSTITSVQEVLTGAGFNITGENGIWGQVLALSGALKPFCYTIIGICILIELAQVAAKVDMLRWEHGLKLCVKMVLSKVCIDVAPDFLLACYNQANIWISSVLQIGNYTAMGTTLKPQIQTSLNNVKSFWAILGIFIILLIIVLAVKICGLLIQVIAYGRMFEMFIYLAVSPFPCAFFPLGDGSGGGFSRITQKFFKSFIAVCLQGVMMTICIRIFSIIMQSTFQRLALEAANAGSADMIVIELCFTMLLGAIVLVISVGKCGSWAKSIIDAT